MEINKLEMLNHVQTYAKNVEHEISTSSADAASKLLAKNIAEETCNVLAAIIYSIRD